MKKYTILIVDDQQVNRRILNKLLQDTYDILEAEDGQAALAQLRAHADEIAAVLLDIVMPVLDGYGVLKAMKADHALSKIPVIVSSQKDGDEAEEKALELGAQDFIAKPYKANIIRHRLNNTIRFRETAAMVNRAEKDELTGLLSKQFFLEKVSTELHQHPENKYDMICLGIERFKLVNDTFGVKTGDRLLRHIAGLIRGQSIVILSSRFGSDQFFLLIPRTEAYRSEYFQMCLKKIREFSLDMDIDINCGVYQIENIDTDADVMCDRAQLAANENKGRYDAMFNLYDDSMRQQLLDEQFITSNMRAALKERQFQVYYQPKYDLSSEMVAGAEALVRWIHPVRGFMSPGEFIPLFEHNGFITSLDEYVWETACRDIHDWMNKGHPAVAVSVNVSRADVYNPRLTDILLGLVKKYDIPVQYLHLEITESAYTNNPEQIIRVVENLRARGFVIEMDDFGSGYSSLNMLAEMPVDVLKLDMKFIQMETARTSGRGILSFVISLAKWMNLSVVAEGVETGEQIMTLRSMDCKYVQGYYFAKPMPCPEFEKLLTTNAVAMPVTEKPRRPAATTQKADTGAGSKTMLIVDDIDINRAVLTEIFSGEYTTVEKENGQVAWDYLNEHYKEVSAVMLDLLMPVMDGFQLLKMIRADARTAALPVIVTSQGDPDTEQKALDLRADEFISKPYNPSVVLRRVDNVVTSCRVRNHQLQELDESRRREQTLINSIPGGVAIYHVKKNGCIATEYVSDGLAELFGYTAEELLDAIREDARVNVLPEDLPHLERALAHSLKNGTPIHEMQRLYTKDRRTINVCMDANVIASSRMESDDVAILYTVHTRLPDTQEGALQEQVRYRYILDNLDVAFFELDQTGTLYASDKYSLYALSDKNQNTIQDEGDYSYVHPDDLPLLFAFFRQKEQHLAKASAVLRLQMKDGSYRWTEMMGFFEYDEEGKKVKTIGVLRDVDAEWLKQNRRLQEALAAAESANRAKTDFLARVSHDMRTPLNGILGLTTLLKNEATGPEVQADLNKLKQSGEYLLNLIDDTLDVSSIETGNMQLKPTVCDGQSAFQTVIAMVQPEVDAKHLQFRVMANNLPFTRLYIDVNRVQQAVMHILSNAVKFTPEGGTVTLIMENLSQENGAITDKIVVRDTGVGMSEEFQKILFEPFSQEHNDTRSIHSGTGLGMTIARQYIEMMGGSISVKSKLGEGTEVTIILPMKVATEAQVTAWSNARMPEIADTMLKGRRILLCEDHPLNAAISAKLLENKGMLVEHAENGKIGLEMFRASVPNYYAAILMDIRMPVMDGLEAAREIRRLIRPDAQNIPIIAMTANAMERDVKDAINAGMSSHLGKPVEPQKLYRTLAELILTPHPQMGRTVLVVDDIEMNRGMIRKAVEPVYQVIEAGNGAAALEILRKEKNIAAVITDIQMPEMDGKELIRQIRAEPAFDRVAILANTIYGDHRQEDELLALGASDFVYKPASPRVVRMRLEHVLRSM